MISITLLLGVSYLTVAMDALPSKSVSLVSEIARGVFPDGSTASWMYYAVQFLTFGILILAANTSYQGFPRLAAVLARDRYFPRQFVNLGDRLVYSNGIIVLAAVAALLIWIFHADVIALIHLYVIGVFTAFTLSQAGMVQHWRRGKEPRWRRRAAINGLGAATTGLVTLLVIQAKFAEGAWMVTIAMPLLILAFLAINRHYRVVARRLRAGTAAVRSSGPATNTAVVYVESLDPATRRAAWYANLIAGRDYHPIHVRDAPTAPTRGGAGSSSRTAGRAIETLEPVENARTRCSTTSGGCRVASRDSSRSILPETFASDARSSAPYARRTTFSLKLRLLVRARGRHLRRPGRARRCRCDRPNRPALPAACSSPASHAATRAGPQLRARRSIFPTRRRCSSRSTPRRRRRMRREWRRADPGLPLEIVEAPFRDLGDPLLALPP